MTYRQDRTSEIQYCAPHAPVFQFRLDLISGRPFGYAAEVQLLTFHFQKSRLPAHIKMKSSVIHKSGYVRALRG